MLQVNPMQPSQQATGGVVNTAPVPAGAYAVAKPTSLLGTIAGAAAPAGGASGEGAGVAGMMQALMKARQKQQMSGGGLPGADPNAPGPGLFGPPQQ